MKKIVLLLLVFGYSSSLPSKVMQDTRIPAVFYNDTRFKAGIFGDKFYPEFSGKTKTFTHAFIAWDLNKVVFTNPNNAAIVKKFTNTHGLKKTAGLWYTFMTLWNKKNYYKIIGDPRGFVWNAMFNEINDTETRKFLFEATREANTIDPGIIDLMKELTLHGHTNVVLSNMGQDTVNYQISYFEKKQKTLEDELNFCGTYRIEELPAVWYDYANTLFIINFLKNPHNVVASKENNWLHKPDKNSYQECINKNPKSRRKGCLKIFIDDKKENVIAAVENDFFDIAILYKAEHNLRFIFQKLEYAFKMVHSNTSEEAKKYFIQNGCNYSKNGITLCVPPLLVPSTKLPFLHIPVMF